MDSPFFETVFSLAGGIINTGDFLFRTLFYSIKDWLAIYPENGLFQFLDKLATLVGLEWFVNNSFVDLIFSPEGIWTILTVLLVYFIIP